jgi:hypothetical protein
MASNLSGDCVHAADRGRSTILHGVLLAKLGGLAVAELALVDEIAKRQVGELDPIRTAGKARRTGSGAARTSGVD